MITYSVYSGAGNTFIVLDNRRKFFSHTWTVPLCQKEKTDGLILLEESETGDYKMAIFNRDGSEAEMCGNGLRCFTRYLQDLKLYKPSYLIETLAGLYTCTFKNNEIFVTSKAPKEIQWDILPNIHFLNTGVPHAVLFCPSVEKIDVEKEGKALRYHPVFGPKGTNVNFVEINKNILLIRTYERGVEGETLACGTGSMAAAFAAYILYELKSPVSVQVRTKDFLKIVISSNLNEIQMSGPARFLSKGSFPINEESSIMGR